MTATLLTQIFSGLLVNGVLVRFYSEKQLREWQTFFNVKMPINNQIAILDNWS